MVATPLAATARYIAPGTRRYYWLPAIANTSAPTRAELNAGTDLTGQIFSAAGWTVTSNLVDAPDFSSRYTPTIPGRITAAASSFMFYMSSTSSDVRTLLTRDLTGFVVILYEGDIPGRKMDVFTVTVSAASKQESDTDPARIEIQFGITAVPVSDLVVPA